MTQLLISLAAIVVLIAMSLSANQRFRAEVRLPMQWSLNGSVNWTAPRAWALAFTPMLASVCLTVTAALTMFSQPREGQENLITPVNLLMASTFVGAHALHLWLIKRTLGKA